MRAVRRSSRGKGVRRAETDRMTLVSAAPVLRPRLLLAMVLIGVASGLGGAAMSWTLHAVQHLCFGTAASPYTDPYSEVDGGRRILALLIVGAVVSLLWWLLRRPQPPVQSVKGMVAADTPVRRQPPMLRGITNAFTQVIAVGGGASIGREVAPREIGALFAGRIGDALGLDPAQRRTMVACGAAAGLAAVYHVPLAGAGFALEILLVSFTLDCAVLALGTCALATIVAWLTVSPLPFYRVEALEGTWPVLLAATAVGLVLALPALGFRRAVARVEARRLTGWRQLAGLPAAFLLTGAVSVALPQALGNGLAAAQWAYDGGSLGTAALLLGVKAVLILATLGAGAVGGTLTPGFSLGAVAGALLGDLAALAVPGTDPTPWALLGAAAFLAVSMNAPLTAILLTIGFTDQPASAFLPIVLAVAVSCACARLVTARAETGTEAGPRP